MAAGFSSRLLCRRCMPGFERAATIDRPPRQVYAVLDDLHGARQWMPAIRKIEVLTPEFAVDVGYRWRETRAVWKVFRMSAELEITEHDAPRTWGLKYEDRKLRMTATFELAPSGTGTLITLREAVEDLQGKPKRAERMAAWMEKADGDLLLRLKAHVESQPAWPAGTTDAGQGEDAVPHASEEAGTPAPSGKARRIRRARSASEPPRRPVVRHVAKPKKRGKARKRPGAKAKRAATTDERVA